MMEISFFFREGGAGEIDGQQVGEYLAAKLNPIDGYRDGVCIYIKQQPPEDFPLYSYVNVVDGIGLIPWIAKHPDIGVIATSYTAHTYLSQRLGRKDIFLIPEHHCNYARVKRPQRKIQTVGIIGTRKGFDLDLRIVEDRLRDMGLQLKTCFNYRTRIDIIDFYKQIDIQICWRPHVVGDHAQLHNPLKLANAGSFGIPTVAFPEDNFVMEFKQAFIPANTPEDLFEGVEDLKNPVIYNAYSKMASDIANRYHIEYVAPLYWNLGEIHYDPVI